MKHREEAYHIGGEDQLKRLAKQGKKPMRDLIKMLIDPGSDFFELGLDAGYNIGQIKLIRRRNLRVREKRAHSRRRTGYRRRCRSRQGLYGLRQ